MTKPNVTKFTPRGYVGSFTFGPVHNLTRSRTAYLLRAARSRRAHNITCHPHDYQINDCHYTITRVRVPALV